MPDSGELLIAGQNIGQINKKELLKLRLNIGMLFQLAALFDSLNIEENIAFPLIENYGLTLNASRNKVNYVLELVGLEGVNKNALSIIWWSAEARGLARNYNRAKIYFMMNQPLDLTQ